MNKPALPPPPIANAADYIDALAQPRAPDSVVKKKVIPGRRMRDKLREAMVVVEVITEPG